jgi:hypothetical protein
MAIVCEGYLEVQVSKENFGDIQRDVGEHVDGLPEEGFTPRLIDMYWTKGAAAVVCQDEITRDWLASSISTLTAWEGSKLKLVGLEALPTYGIILVWLPGPAEETGQYLQRLRRLNQGLETDNWRIYGRKEESNGVCLHLLLILNSFKWY